MCPRRHGKRRKDPSARGRSASTRRVVVGRRTHTAVGPSVPDEEIFEAALRSLSTRAFNAVVACGVRDLPHLLSLDETALHARPGIGSRTVEEVAALQVRLHSRIARRRSTRLQIGEVPARGQRSGTPHEPVASPSSSRTRPGSGSVAATASDVASRIFRAGTRSVRTAQEDRQACWEVLLAQCSTAVRRVMDGLGARSIEAFLRLTQAQICEQARSRSDVVAAASALQNLVCGVLYALCEPGRPIPWDQVGDRLAECAVHPDLAQTYRSISMQPRAWIRKPEPDRSSVLWLTLKASPLEPETGTLAALGLSVDAWKRLSRAQIFPDDPVCTLEWLVISYWLAAGTDDAALDRLIHIAGLQTVDVCAKASSTPIMSPEEVVLIRNLRVEGPDTPAHLVEAVRLVGVRTWGDAALLSEKAVLELLGARAVAYRAIYALWELRGHAQTAIRHLSSGLPAEAYASFRALMDAFVALGARDLRDDAILRGRLGLRDGRKWTLEGLGNELGITRERVRQIEKKRVGALHRNTGQLWLLWLTITDVLMDSGGVCLTADLARKLAERFGWESSPDAGVLKALISLREDASLDVRPDRVVLTSHPCPSCTGAREALKEAVCASGGVTTTEEALTHVVQYCQQQCSAGRGTQDAVTAGLVQHLADTAADLRRRDATIYTADEWTLRFGRRSDAIDVLLRLTPRPMRCEEVMKALRRYRKDDKGIAFRNVYARLGGSDHMLWGRGEFIHRAHVAVPTRLLSKIIAWLIRKLQAGQSFYSVHGVFARFESACKTSGLPTTYALYTCLREYAGQRLGFPHFPYIVATPDTERMPLALALEEHALSTGAPVETGQLLSYAQRALGVSRQLFGLHLPNVPNLIRVAPRQYIHADLLALSSSALAPLISVLREFLQTTSHVSVQKLFEARKVTCRLLGISSAAMLYSVLKHSGPPDLFFSGYPQVRAAEAGSEDTGQGLAGEVAAYLAARRAPCGVSELEDRFVEELGYRSRTLYSGLSRPEVVRYSRSAYVHLKSLRWSDDRQGALESCARRRYAQCLRAGSVYAQISELLDGGKLPRLPDGTLWTRTLLASLLPRRSAFAVLGSQRNAYVPLPNDHDIATLADLIATLLSRDYEGACAMEEMERALLRGGVLGNRLTPAMLGDGGRVRLQGSIVMLAELAGHA
jgi:hypothetical protein